MPPKRTSLNNHFTGCTPSLPYVPPIYSYTPSPPSYSFSVVQHLDPQKRGNALGTRSNTYVCTSSSRPPLLPPSFCKPRCSLYSVQAISLALDTAWILLGAVMVFFMQVMSAFDVVVSMLLSLSLMLLLLSSSSG